MTDAEVRELRQAIEALPERIADAVREGTLRGQPGIIGIDPEGVPIRGENREDTSEKLNEISSQIDQILMRLASMDDSLADIAEAIQALARERGGP